MPKQELDGQALFDLALSVVGLVLNEGDRKISELAEIFEVSERAILRSVKAISESEDLTRCETHFYLNYDELEDGWVSFSQGRSSLAGPPQLSKRQLTSIAIGLDYLASLPQFAGNQDLATLRKSFATSSTAPVQLPANRLLEQIELIQSAISDSMALECEYQNQLGERSERRVDPLRLDFVGKRHYLRGYCHLTHEVRSFRLDRITKLELGETQISAAAKAAVVPEEVFGQAAQEQSVKISADPEAAEIFWNFPAANEPKLQDGKLVGEIRIGNLESLPRHIIRYGGMVEVLAPETARDLVREAAQKLLEEEEA
jgi:proteasome accessory factor C